SEQSLWFRIGYALERARQPAPSAGRKLDGLEERARRRAARRAEDRDGEGASTDDLVSMGLTLAAGKLLDLWRPRHRARFTRLLRAGAAGAGAALLLDLLRPLLTGRPEVGTLDRETGDRVIVGLGQGLLYGAVVEPRLPGPPVLKGALFGSAEYASDPAGGLTHLVGAHTLQGRLPVIGSLLENIDPHDRTYVEHLAFGIALALLYGAAPSSNGMAVGDEDG
ncbi:MAG TPA: hypothetical protein VLA09_02355, partial [Longimicrobiales bacterium]|nr:hypothetical protein [Longimicrobiales bacterium]